MKGFVIAVVVVAAVVIINIIILIIIIIIIIINMLTDYVSGVHFISSDGEKET